MLHGPLFMKIIMFTLPLAASSILQQLFNSVDVAVVGRFASSQALAAVGSNAPVISLLINLFMGVSMGASINGYGSDAIAGSAAALNFEYYCYFIIGAFNGAAISFTGQNYGAGLNHRVKRIFAICLFMGFVGCATLNWLFIWQEDFFLSLFTDSPKVIAFGETRMHIALAWQSIAAFYEIPGSVLRGMGKSMEPTLITVFGTCLLRIAWIFIIMPGWRDFDHLLAVYPVSWAITALLMLGLYTSAPIKSPVP